MKHFKTPIALALVALFTASPLVAFAAEKNKDKEKDKAKPYTLEKCIVSDEKLGEMGDPFVFTYKGQEMKLCCKSCKKDFDKDPAKFVAKLEKAAKEKDAKNKK
jgi:YHS domain-containing protein